MHPCTLTAVATLAASPLIAQADPTPLQRATAAPLTGDKAGAFGFSPWGSADRRCYGIVARDPRSGVLSADAGENPAVASVNCGREICAAWMDGRPRP